MTTFGKLSPPKRYTHLLCENNCQTIHDFLCEKLPDLKPAKLRWLIEFGAVYSDGARIIDASTLIQKGKTLRVHLEPKRYPTFDLKNLLIFENEYFMVIDKPPGLPMHATLDNFYENLLTGLEKLMQKKIFITHRLDVPTSGLAVFAKSPGYQTVFNQLISERKISKEYEALTKAKPVLGDLRHWMLASPKAPKVLSAKAEAHGKWDQCHLKITSIQEIERERFAQREIFYKCAIELLTGRTHQIRAQLSFEKTPIIGDEMYGGLASDWFGLTATRLSFTCPVSKTVHLFDREIALANRRPLAQNQPI